MQKIEPIFNVYDDNISCDENLVNEDNRQFKNNLTYIYQDKIIPYTNRENYNKNSAIFQCNQEKNNYNKTFPNLNINDNDTCNIIYKSNNNINNDNLAKNFENKKNKKQKNSNNVEQIRILPENTNINKNIILNGSKKLIDTNSKNFKLICDTHDIILNYREKRSCACAIF